MLDFVSVVLISTVALILLLLRWERSAFVRQIDRIPGPPKVPFFGNVFDVPRDGSTLHHIMNVKWVKEYGRVYRTWRGTSAMVAISTPQHVERILTSQKNINKGNYYSFFEPWLGNGLVTSSGEKWKKDRRLLTPAFHFQILGDFFEVFNRNADIFVEQIESRLADSQEIDVFPMALRCTLDVICEAAMGIKMNTQIESNSEYINAVNCLQGLMKARFYSRIGMLPDWAYFTLTKNGRKLKKCLEILHNFTRNVLRERKKVIEQTESLEIDNFENEISTIVKKSQPFLDLLLWSVKKGADLSEFDIISQVNTFMFALHQGHDTTATALTWFLYCMATHPKEQELVFKEIQECFGDPERPCALEDLPKLKYLEYCVKEAIRLHPAASSFHRYVSEEVQFDDYTVPVGASIIVQIYALHHNEDVFPDAMTFKPERFQLEQTTGRHPFAFIPFSAGPRNCIGQKLAIYEEKVIIVALLRKFRFAIDFQHLPVREVHGIVMKPANGMPLTITLR